MLGGRGVVCAKCSRAGAELGIKGSPVRGPHSLLQMPSDLLGAVSAEPWR